MFAETVGSKQRTWAPKKETKIKSFFLFFKCYLFLLVKKRTIQFTLCVVVILCPIVMMTRWINVLCCYFALYWWQNNLITSHPVSVDLSSKQITASLCAGKQHNAAGIGTCRFCGSTGTSGLLAMGNVCSDPDCQVRCLLVQNIHSFDRPSCKASPPPHIFFFFLSSTVFSLVGLKLVFWGSLSKICPNDLWLFRWEWQNKCRILL